MVGPEVVDLLPEDCHPKVLAYELEKVQLVLKLWIVLSQLLNQTVSGVETCK